MLQLGLPVLCWIEVSRVDILALFLILKETLSVSPVKYNVSCGLLIDSLYYVEAISFYSCLLVFYHKRVLFCEILFCVHWDDHLIFIPHSVMWHVTLLTWCVEPSLYIKGKSHWVMMYNLFNKLSNYFLTFCWEFLCLHSSGILAYNILFLY